MSSRASRPPAWNQRLAPALAASHIRIVRWRQLSKSDRAFATRFFDEQVDPLLTPVTIDPSHPFPRVLNKALCLALLLKLKRRGRIGHATVARRHHDSALAA